MMSAWTLKVGIIGNGSPGGLGPVTTSATDRHILRGGVLASAFPKAPCSFIVDT